MKRVLERNADLICHAGYIAACLALMLRDRFTAEIDAQAAPSYITVTLFLNDTDLARAGEYIADAVAEVDALLLQFPASDGLHCDVKQAVSHDAAAIQITVSLLEIVPYNGNHAAGA